MVSTRSMQEGSGNARAGAKGINGTMGDPDTHTYTHTHTQENGKIKQDAKGNGVHNLKERCDEVAQRVNKFLDEDFGDGEQEEVLRGVQRQTRIALGVIESCLGRYRYVIFLFGCEVRRWWVCAEKGSCVEGKERRRRLLIGLDCIGLEWK